MRFLINLFKREPDFIVGRPDDPYLLRWYIIPQNRFFNIYLHKFLRDDDDRALHDHPWPSLSIILKGVYIEHVKGNTYLRKAPNLVYRSAKHAHRIELHSEIGIKQVRNAAGVFEPALSIVRKPAWTLFITGPKMRDWGFHCPKGWVHWRDFVDQTDHGNVGKGCGD